MADPITHPTLRRTMGLLQATAMVVGIILGASIFVQPSEITRYVPTISGILLVWLLCGLLTFCGALVCAELASAFPRTGGVYFFLKETYSPGAGFLWGWAMFWSMHAGIIAAMAVIFARYAGYFIPLSAGETRLTAIGAVVALSAVNYAGVRPGSSVQTWFTLAKVVAVGGIFAAFFLLGSPATSVPRASGEFGSREFALALSAGLFAYGGWHMVTYAADETRRPQVTLPRALVIGTLIITACYLGLNAAYLYVLPLHQVIASTRVAADAAVALLGARGGAAVSVLVLISVFGALNGVILAGPRVYYAMAQDGLAFRWLGAVHPKFRTPHLAIAAQAVWASVLVATDTYHGLFSRVVYTEWLFFALMTLGLFRLRRRADYAPTFRTWGYPVAPVLFVASALVIVVNQVAAEPVNSALGLLLIAAGWPVYYFWARKGARQGANAHGHH